MKKTVVNSFSKALVLSWLVLFAAYTMLGCSQAGTEVAPTSTSSQVAQETSSVQIEDAEEPVVYSFRFDQANNDDAYTYVVFAANNEANTGLETINAHFKQEAESAQQNKYVDGSVPAAESNTQYSNSVTYLENNWACVSASTYMYSGGAHGYSLPRSVMCNLETGEMVSSLEYLGLSLDQAEGMARAALDAFLEHYTQPSVQLKANADEVFQYSSFQEMLDYGMLDLSVTPDGLVMLCNNEVIGPHAAGAASLLICDLKGNPIAEGDFYETKNIGSSVVEQKEPELSDSASEDPLAPYAPIVGEYQSMMSSSSAPSQTSVNPSAWSAHYDANGFARDVDLKCALVDLAGDENPELVVGYKFPSAGNGSGTSGSSATYRVFDLYTISDGSAQKLIAEDELGINLVAYFYQDGTVHMEQMDYGNNGMRYISENYRLEPNGSELQFVERLETGNGNILTSADGTARELSGEELAEYYEAHSVANIMEDIAWTGIADASSIGIPVSAGQDGASTANEQETEQPSGEVMYYLTMLVPDYYQSGSLTDNTLEITARFSVDPESPEFSNISSSFETFSFSISDDTYYYGTGGLSEPTVFSKDQANAILLNPNGLGIVLKVQDGNLLEIRFAS